MEQLSQLLQLQMQDGGRARLTVTGGSMLPMLRQRRDAVELVQVDRDLKKGDIILYRRENGQYVLHRIVGMGKSLYLCSGDNEAKREPVAPHQVLAVVDGFIRKGKHRTIDGFGYGLYKRLWLWGFPLRGIYIAIRRRLGKLRSRLKRRR